MINDDACQWSSKLLNIRLKMKIVMVYFYCLACWKSVLFGCTTYWMNCKHGRPTDDCEEKSGEINTAELQANLQPSFLQQNH